MALRTDYGKRNTGNRGTPPRQTPSRQTPPRGQQRPPATARPAQGRPAQGRPSAAERAKLVAAAEAELSGKTLSGKTAPAQLEVDSRFRLVPVDQIVAMGDRVYDSAAPRRNQPRLDFTEEDVEEMAVSIREHGLLQPLVVREVIGPDGLPRFELIAGERRWRAGRIAGAKFLPALVRTNTSERQAYELAIVENIDRKDLSDVELGIAFLQLKTDMEGTLREFLELNHGAPGTENEPPEPKQVAKEIREMGVTRWEHYLDRIQTQFVPWIAPIMTRVRENNKLPEVWWDDVAKRVRRSTRTVLFKVSTVNLPDVIQQDVMKGPDKGGISGHQARAIVVVDKDKRVKLWKKIKREKLSGPDAMAVAREWNGDGDGKADGGSNGSSSGGAGDRDGGGDSGDDGGGDSSTVVSTLPKAKDALADLQHANTLAANAQRLLEAMRAAELPLSIEMRRDLREAATLCRQHSEQVLEELKQASKVPAGVN